MKSTGNEKVRLQFLLVEFESDLQNLIYLHQQTLQSNFYILNQAHVVVLCAESIFS